MKEIGGYFELELPPKKGGRIPIRGLKVNSGRHALEYILRSFGNRIKKVWLPYYTCEVVLEPLRRLNLSYDLYPINESIEIKTLPELRENEYIIVNNYFGIKDTYVRKISNYYKGKCVIDNAQALYYPTAIDENSFFSPRKFFGVPDGGVACSTKLIEAELQQDMSYNRISHLVKRMDLSPLEGHSDFKTNSAKLKDEQLKSMSKLTDRILDSIDYDLAKIKRRSNFEMLHGSLKDINGLNIPCSSTFSCPMVYPFLTNDEALRDKLIQNKIYVATYWPNVLKWCEESSLEHKLANYLIPLPIDQRYSEEDMSRIIEIIYG